MPTSEIMNRPELEAALIKRCWADDAFRAAVLADPKGMWEKAIGAPLPQSLKIYIHEEDSQTLHLSLPPKPKHAEELSDAELERVAGGTEIVLGVTLILSATAGVAAMGSAAMVTPTKQGW